MQLTYSILLLELPSHFVLSKKQRPTYYKETDKIPKKYVKDDSYQFQLIKGKSILVNSITNEVVIKNPNKVGKPKLKTINGQDLFNTSGNAFITNNCLDQIKEWFCPQWERIDNMSEVVRLQAVAENNTFAFRFVYKTPRKDIEDLDNFRILYEKAIIDSLKVFKYFRQSAKHPIEEVANPYGFLSNDNVTFLNQITSRWEESDTRELELKIYAHGRD